MSEFPLGYERLAPTSWVYLSSLLMLGLFFKFNRVWSVRNLDLILLILWAPGLLLVFHSGYANPEAVSAIDVEATSQPEKPLPKEAETPAAVKEGVAVSGDETGAAAKPAAEAPQSEDAAALGAAVPSPQLTAQQKQARLGYIWLFVVSGLFVMRMLADTRMARRPLLEPNLSTGGLTFIGCSLFVFLMANVVTSQTTASDLEGPRSGERLVQREPMHEDDDYLTRHGPGYPLLSILPDLLTIQSSKESKEHQYATQAKVMAILCNLAIVVGLVLVGYRHFGSFKMGVAVATLFLMLPYTAIWNAHAKHVIPAALLVWAVVCYRKPLLAGVFIGVAAGVLYYPLFLIPVWISFYLRRGVWRFVGSTALTLAVMASTLAFRSEDFAHFVLQLRMMFGFWLPLQEDLTGLWGLGWDPIYRLPILVAFMAMSIMLALWPARKNLGTLISCSAALMAATQFWHGHEMGGGVYLAWYAPLALLVIFRPNLEDRVAPAVLGESRLPWRNGKAVTKPKAA